MPIGLMNQRITVYRYVDRQSASGMMTRVREPLCAARARLLKASGSFAETGAGDLADTMTCEFEVWKTSFMNVRTSDVLCWNGDEFKITLIDTSPTGPSVRVRCVRNNR